VVVIAEPPDVAAKLNVVGVRYFVQYVTPGNNPVGNHPVVDNVMGELSAKFNVVVTTQGEAMVIVTVDPLRPIPASQ
jgi:hypothetical protein